MSEHNQNYDDYTSSMREVHEANRHLLNQLVGLESQGFVAQEDEAQAQDLAESLNRGTVLSVKLYLQPDTQINRALDGDEPHLGDPMHVSYEGSMPEDTERMISETIEGVEGKLLKSSDNKTKSYLCELAGSPFIIEVHDTRYSSIGLDDEVVTYHKVGMLARKLRDGESRELADSEAPSDQAQEDLIDPAKKAGLGKTLLRWLGL